jgi:hypothetical protein
VASLVEPGDHEPAPVVGAEVVLAGEKGGEGGRGIGVEGDLDAIGVGEARQEESGFRVKERRTLGS